MGALEPAVADCEGGKRKFSVGVSTSENQPQDGGTMELVHEGGGAGTGDVDLSINLKPKVEELPGDLDPLSGLDEIGEALKRFLADDFNWLWPCTPPALLHPDPAYWLCPGLVDDPDFPDPDDPPPPEKELVKLTPPSVPFRGPSPGNPPDSLGLYPAQPALEHFKCYETARKRFKTKRVRIENQFEKRRIKLPTRMELCNPAQKFREPWLNERAHHQCYSTKGPSLGIRVATRNQFGMQRFRVGEAKRLCLPTRKKELNSRERTRIRPHERIDHQTCYSITAVTALQSVDPKPRQVRTKDQFKTERVKLFKPKWLCAPTDKNREGMDHPVAHLVCYTIKGKRNRKKVEIRNQFERTNIKARDPRLLCVPTDKAKLGQ